MGELVVELYWKHAPMTCRNFAELARRGYYNGTKFHRIIRDFMIQGKLSAAFLYNQIKAIERYFISEMYSLSSYIFCRGNSLGLRRLKFVFFKPHSSLRLINVMYLIAIPR